ncbi:MAG: antitoxin [Thermoleophilia bacterium]|nr:antitoxin [Thermoleophilia bacterium]
MTRTTLDLDATVMRELRRRQAVEGKTIGALVSELLAVALAEPPAPTPAFSWTSRPMAARVDLDDKDAVYAALDAR